MRKSWKLTKKILTGQKKIESRWYKTKYPPFGKIKAGDRIFFKDSGDPVIVKAEVSDVKQFSDLDQNRIKELLETYSEDDGIERHEIMKYYRLFKDKKYCILVFIKNPVAIKPFKINKKGYGMMSSWICINKIDDIRKK
jgi:ASC-1-like (ASCH) protein